jgi:competence protein ComEC
VKKLLRILVFLLIFTTIIPCNAESTLEIRFFDVGHADAALIICDGQSMLIDGGNKSDSSLIYTALKNANITHLDIVVASHAHADHIGGLPGAFSYATADLTLCPVTSSYNEAFPDFEKYATEKGNGIKIPSVGDTYTLGNAVVTILGLNGGASTNNTSIILKVQHGNSSFLFAGDAEQAAEHAVIESGFDLSATLLKVAHHGSSTSTTHTFLGAVNPVYAIISNDSDDPVTETMQKLYSKGIVLYQTCLHGDIVVTSDGNRIAVSTEKNLPLATEAPQSNEFVLNTSTKKIHRPTCSGVSKMKEENKRTFTGDKEQLLDSGYEPCKSCNP